MIDLLKDFVSKKIMSLRRVVNYYKIIFAVGEPERIYVD